MVQVNGKQIGWRKKVKKAMRKRAHMVSCKGIEKLKRSNVACKIKGVIADLRETAWP